MPARRKSITPFWNGSSQLGRQVQSNRKPLIAEMPLGLGDQAVGGTSLIFRRGQVAGDRAQASLWAVMRNAVFADVGVGYRVVGVESCGTRRYGIAVGI